MKWFFTHIVKIYFLAVAVLALYLWNDLFPGDTDAHPLPHAGQASVEAPVEADVQTAEIVETPSVPSMDGVMMEHRPETAAVDTTVVSMKMDASDGDDASGVAEVSSRGGVSQPTDQDAVTEAADKAAEVEPPVADVRQGLADDSGDDEIRPLPFSVDADSVEPQPTGPVPPAEPASVQQPAPPADRTMPLAGIGVNERFLRARAAFWKRHPDLAVQEYAAILEHEPGNWAALAEMGNVRLMMGDRDLALQAYRRAAGLMWRSGERFRAWKLVTAIAEYAPEEAAALAEAFRRDAMNIRRE